MTRAGLLASEEPFCCAPNSFGVSQQLRGEEKNVLRAAGAEQVDSGTGTAEGRAATAAVSQEGCPVAERRGTLSSVTLSWHSERLGALVTACLQQWEVRTYAAFVGKVWEAGRTSVC